MISSAGNRPSFTRRRAGPGIHRSLCGPARVAASSANDGDRMACGRTQGMADACKSETGIELHIFVDFHRTVE